MNQKIWGILLIGVFLMNLGLGANNLYQFTMDDTDYLSLGFGILQFGFVVWFAYLIWYKWYPQYLLEQGMKRREY